MKLWEGRFSQDLDEQAQDFNRSLPFDFRLAKQDILGSIAHVTMLGNTGILSKADEELAVKALNGLLAQVSDGTLVLDDSEDIHSFVEAALTRTIGDAGKRIHTARSRNDQVATDFRLFCKDACNEVIALLLKTNQTIVSLAQEHMYTIMPGYTHLQRAQPVTLAHHLLAWFWMFSRDITRLRDARNRMDLSPLGAGALAGTTFPIDRELTAKNLGFADVMPNSMDAVADRDFAVELVSALAQIMTHLSRMSEEIILWSSSEFGFATLGDSFSTGSSIMPQKKNPDMAELIRGKTGRVYGSLLSLLTTLKGLPLAYNKDLQEDKEPVFDALDTISGCLNIFPGLLNSLTFHKDTMMRAAATGFLNATDCADYLATKGVPFRDAYHIVGQLVAPCIASSYTLDDLPLEQLKSFSPLFEEDVYERLSLSTCVEGRNSQGGPSSQAVKEQLKLAQAFLTETYI
jgi:argininosuccinate lyase